MRSMMLTIGVCLAIAVSCSAPPPYAERDRIRDLEQQLARKDAEILLLHEALAELEERTGQAARPIPRQTP